MKFLTHNLYTFIVLNQYQLKMVKFGQTPLNSGLNNIEFGRHELEFEIRLRKFRAYPNQKHCDYYVAFANFLAVYHICNSLKQ